MGVEEKSDPEPVIPFHRNAEIKVFPPGTTKSPVGEPDTIPVIFALFVIPLLLCISS